MDNIRRSKRTPKPKGASTSKPIIASTSKPTIASISKTKSTSTSKPECASTPEASSINRVDPIKPNAATDGVPAICKKLVSKKPKKLGTFVINCGEITGEIRIDLDAFKTYFQGKIKVGRKCNDPRVKVELQDMKILVHADVFIEKKYIKYLVKLFLKSKKLKNWIRIINEKRSYVLKYYRRDDC